MNYTTAFDVTQSGFRAWVFAGPGLLCLALSTTVFVLVKKGVLKESPSGTDRWFPRFIFGFALFWGSFAVFGPLIEYRRAIGDMQSNRTEVVEGVVTNFVPMPYEGHANESFTVQGIEFEYSDYEITAGFNNSTSHGGPIREGLPVKIWYSGREILRLDIGKEPN